MTFAHFPILPGLAMKKVRRPKYNTVVQTAASGAETRVGLQSEPLWEWDISFDVIRDAGWVQNGSNWQELLAIVGLFNQQYGSLIGFTFRDFDDDHALNQTIGTTVGSQVVFDLVRVFGTPNYNGNSYFSPTEHIGILNTSVTAPVPFQLYVDGVAKADTDGTWGYTLLTGTPKLQRLQFNSTVPAGSVLTVDESFSFYVRFKDDVLDFDKFYSQLWELKKVALVSLSK